MVSSAISACENLDDMRDEPGPFVQGRRGRPVGDLGVEAIVDLGAIAFRSPIQAELAAIDLGDSEPSGFEGL